MRRWRQNDYNFMADWLFKEIPVYKVYLGWLAFLLLLIIIGSIVSPSRYHISKVKAQIISTRLTETAMATALKAYSNTYSVLPVGNTESVERILAGENLYGKNPQKISHLLFMQTAEHPNKMVDSWGTPYQIEFLQRTNFVILSAGRNQKFGDADDIVFNSISNDFVKP
jgi:hypothetical protein